MAMKDILKKEIDRISLSREESLNLEEIAKDFIKLLKKEGFKVHIGGSLAKGTVVRREGNQDVDIFVVFNYSEDIFKLERVLNKIKLPGKLKKVHGSRDYFQIICKDVLLEIIPVVKNNDPELAENITDISLSHVKYIVGEIKNMTEQTHRHEGQTRRLMPTEYLIFMEVSRWNGLLWEVQRLLTIL